VSPDDIQLLVENPADSLTSEWNEFDFKNFTYQSLNLRQSALNLAVSLVITVVVSDNIKLSPSDETGNREGDIAALLSHLGMAALMSLSQARSLPPRSDESEQLLYEAEALLWTFGQLAKVLVEMCKFSGGKNGLQ